MAAKPALEPTLAQEEEQEENDEGEDSDVYDVEGDEEGDEEDDVYEPEDGDEEGNEGRSPENMTALLLGKQNGARTEEEEEEEDDDDEYHEDREGTAENTPVVAGSKRGVDELSEGDECGGENDEEAEVEEKNVKKARV